MATLPVDRRSLFLDDWHAKGTRETSNFGDSQGLCRSKLNFIGSHNQTRRVTSIW